MSETFTNNQFYQGAWLVYINGLEVPCPSVTVEFGVWKLPTATLEMIPHSSLSGLGREDRLKVEIFYLDEFINPKNPHFCLLGEFEVVGISVTRTAMGRRVNLSCVSELQLMQQLNFFYMSSIQDMAVGLGPEGVTAPSITLAKPHYPSSLFLEGLVKIPAGEEIEDSGKFVRRPIDFVLNVFKFLHWAVDSESEDPRVTDKQDKMARAAVDILTRNFFSRKSFQNRLYKKWAAIPVLEDMATVKDQTGCFPVIKAAQDVSVMNALHAGIGMSVGQAGTVWDLWKMVLGTMYMEICAIPSPPIVSLKKGTAEILGKPSKEPVSGDKYNGLSSYCVKPQCMFALPPTCNIIFPSMITNFSMSEAYNTQPTRIYMGEQFISQLVMASKQNQLQSLTNQLLTTGFPTPIADRMSKLVATPTSNCKNFLLYPEEVFKGPVATRLNAPPWLYLLQQMRKAKDGTDQKGVSDAPLTEEEQALIGELPPSYSNLGDIFDTYAKYEYYRTRYSMRNGSVNMAWNPYLVPGFPAIIFDDRSSRMDYVGYVTGVRHTMSSSPGGAQMSSSASLSFVRSFNEYINLQAADWERQFYEKISVFDAPTEEAFIFRPTKERPSVFLEEDAKVEIDCAPPEPLPELQRIFQRTTTTETVYRKLLYQDRELKSKKTAVFDWRRVLTAKDLGDGNYVVVPKDNYRHMFKSYQAAMEYVARPGCSLKSYIEFKHEKKLEDIPKKQLVGGLDKDTFYSNMRAGAVGAKYWKRIYKLKQGPSFDGKAPPVKFTNMGPYPSYSFSEGGWNSDDSSVAETRQDWDSILERYRRMVYNQEFPED